MQEPGVCPWHYQGDTMKKKSIKKLVLAKETVRSLEVVTLNEVVGGSDLTCTGAGSCRFCNPSGADVC
jgi:hypothetical protein